MEPRDVIILVFVGIGVLILKGFADLLMMSIPPWLFYAIVILFAVLAVFGVFLFLEKKMDESHRQKFNLKARTAVLFEGPKMALFDSVGLWLSWPWWAIMLIIWKIFEPWSSALTGALARNLGIDLQANLPFIGSPLAVVSIILTYFCLVFATSVFFTLYSLRVNRTGAGRCPRCGTMHNPADNYCSNCGAVLKMKRI